MPIFLLELTKGCYYLWSPLLQVWSITLIIIKLSDITNTVYSLFTNENINTF